MTVAAVTPAAPAAPATDAWSEAGADDDGEIRSLLRRPMDGRIRVALTREPDSRIAAAVEGERHTTVVARDAGGRLVGFGSRSVRRVWGLDGAPVRLGYLGQLRTVHRGCGPRRLAEGYARLRAARRPDEVPFDLTTILADNHRARRLLERGLRGLPRYRPLAEIETLVIPAGSSRRPRARPAPRTLAAAERRALLDFLEGELRRRPFAPVWTGDDLDPEGRARGLSWDDFHVVEEGGRIVAAAALWDQRAYKQAVIDGYSGGLATLRPLVNLGLRASGRPTLPPAGSVLPLAFVAAFVAAGDDPDLASALVGALRREARRRGLSQIVVSLAAGRPLGRALLREHRARPYRSILYTVSWPGDPAPPRPNDLGPGGPWVEAALL